MNKKRETDIAAEDALLRLKSGENEALGIIYDCYGRMIFSAALGITGNYSDAEDVLQDSMLQLLKYSASYKKGTSPRAFVMAIGRHRAIDIVRRKRNELSLDDISLSNLESAESIEEAEKRIAPDVKALLSLLDEEEKQVIIFRIYAEMSFSEVAKTMKITVFAAQKRYQRALKKLKNIAEVGKDEKTTN